MKEYGVGEILWKNADSKIVFCNRGMKNCMMILCAALK